jgi:hypothetical protein
MSVVIKQIISKSDIKKFIKFQINLYKDCQYFVPPLISDEISTFLPDKNPAFELSEAKIFLAYKDNEICGRIMAIHNQPANKKYNENDLRFGWFDCIDDFEVAKALLGVVENWARELKCTTITGPHGFCDLDPQGLLIEGFDKMATIASYYNFPYYRDFIEKLGFTKEIDYLEYFSTTPKDGVVPEKLNKAEEWVTKRYGYQVLRYDSPKKYRARGKELFELLNESFEKIYGSVTLNEKQIEYYIKKYISFIHKDLIKMVTDSNDKLIGFMITMPNLSTAFKKAKGNLLPFGVFHILKAMKTYEILDF